MLIAPSEPGLANAPWGMDANLTGGCLLLTDRRNPAWFCSVFWYWRPTRWNEMSWRVVERHIGRAGGLRQRTARQRDWDRKYGEGNWQVGYVLGGRFAPQEEALESVYYRSYAEHFATHPE